MASQKNASFIKNTTILLIISLLTTSCTALLISNSGTDYRTKVHCGTPMAEIHRTLGEPTEINYFREFKEIDSIDNFPKLYNTTCIENNPKISGYEKFIVTGTIRRGEEDLGAGYFVLFDLMTLFTIELIAFPMAATSYIEEKNTEKEITVWYDEYSKFIAGEIVNQKTGKKLITLN